MKRKELRKNERASALDVTSQSQFEKDGHEHVFLKHPKTGRIVVKTKKDHPGKIAKLLRQGYEIIERPY